MSLNRILSRMKKHRTPLRLSFVIAVCATLAIVISTSCTLPTSLIKASRNSSIMAIPQEGRVRAPELTGGRGWLNTDKPLSLAALKGKFVLLDFWTYGCINCIHIIPDLKRLEEKYAKQLVVIGVHSAKFDNEKDTENIRRIVIRYEIEHPVVNDADFSIWEAYGVRAWPTQVLIDPAGYVMGSVSGEGNFQVIDEAITAAVEEFRRRGELNEQPLSLALERARVGDLPLAFPGKVLADAKSDRLFIADSNHNRIVVTRLDGTFLESIGTGAPGQTDGAYERATFYRPQGMALDSEILYVADTENHLIRRVNLKSRIVETVAGTGKQSREYYQSGAARTIALNSPWDLQIVGRSLFIAMAGPHQIWKLDLDKNEISTFAGSGREARTDGPLMTSGFAQPSGLASDGKSLYVADSEANILRGISFSEGLVKTLAGGDLFEFGDQDGAGDEVRLQHPLGLAILDGRVLIADTYNHKIKSLDPTSGSVKSLFGTGKPGQADGRTPSFYEPGGLSVANGKLFVADTNNHAVRVIDLKSGQTSTLMLKNLAPPVSTVIPATDSSTGPNGEEIVLPAQRLRNASDGSLLIDVALPAGYHLNPSAPQRYKISVDKGANFLSLTGAKAGTISQTSKDLKFPLKVQLRAQQPGQVDLRIQATLFYCREDNTGTCQIKTLVWRAPVDVVLDKSASSELKATATIR